MFGGIQKVMAKVEKKEEEKKSEVKLKGDSGYKCSYCNGHNHLAMYVEKEGREERKGER